MKKTLKQLRSEIASLDASILHSIHKRNQCAEAIAERKHARRNPLRAPEVEGDVYRRNTKLGKNLGLEERFVFQLTKRIIAQSLSWQKQHLSKKLSSLDDGSRELHRRTGKLRKNSSLG